MTIELKQKCLEIAADVITSHMSAPDTAAVLPLAQDFYAWLNGDAAAPTGNEKPATRGRKSNAASAPADTAASEPSSPSDAKPPLVADEGNPQTATQNADTAQTPVGSTATPISDPAPTANTAIAEPTQEQKDALLKEATEFSQKHGHDALLGALKAVGAERFSAIPFAKYGDFRSAMAGHAAGASALS